MTLSPPRCSRLPGPYGPVAPAHFPSVLRESPVFGTQDRIYCVPRCRRDKLTNQHYVDKATWREAFDHEAFHSEAVQGSAPLIRGPSPSGGSVPPGLFLPGGKGVDRPIPQGMDRGEKLAENIWLRKPDSVVGPAHDPDAATAPVRPPWPGGRGGIRQAARGTAEPGRMAVSGRWVYRRPGRRMCRTPRGRPVPVNSRTPSRRRLPAPLRHGAPGCCTSVRSVRCRNCAAPACGRWCSPARWSPNAIHCSRELDVLRNRHCHTGPPRACSLERRTRFAGVWAVEEWRRTLGGKGLGR